MKEIRWIALGIVAALTFFPALSGAQTEDAGKILAQAGSGVLTLVTYGPDKAEIAKGSALALSEDVVATAYHLIASAADAEGITVKGKKIKVDGILAVDRSHDLAFLKLKGKIQALPLGSAEGMEPGARLFALGANESGEIIVSEGTLRRTVELGPQEKILDVSLTVPEPLRGGPILNLGGQVVAMMLIMDRGVRFGLPVSVLLALTKFPKATEFKAWTKENYFDILEGASFAGRAAAALDEQMAARIHLEKAVKLNPALAEIQARLAEIYAKQRDYSAAVGAYRKVTQLDPSRGDAFYGLGQVLLRTGSRQEAAEALEKAASLNVAAKELYFDLGSVYEELQNWAKAAEAYEKYLGLKPEVSWTGYLRLGLTRMKLEQYDAAIAAILEARRGQPQDVKVNFSLAESYEKAGQFEKAEEVYNSLAQINPAEAKSYYTQAIRMYDSAGKFDLAINPAKKIVDLEPQNEMNIYNLGLMYFKLQKYDEAIETFKKCLAVKPDYTYAWFQTGSAYIQKQKYKEAAEAYKKFVELVPEEASGWLSLGVSYMYLKNFEAALEPMKKAVDLKPENANALYNLAIVYLNLQDNYSAREIYKKLVAIDPPLAEKLKKHLR